jgi:hypothetical protein
MERRRALTLTLSTIEQLKNKKRKRKKKEKTCFALIYLVPLGFTRYYDDCSFEIDIIRKKKKQKKK